VAETDSRREIWLDLAENYHSMDDWSGLLWACTSGFGKVQRTNSYLDDDSAWGFRLPDLAALACCHLGLFDRAVDYGITAAQLKPDDARLQNNLAHYKQQMADARSLLPVSTPEKRNAHEPLPHG
jgi:hypothetical protein